MKGIRVLGYAVLLASSVFTTSTSRAAVPAPLAAPITLLWNRGSDTNAIGYAVYYGQLSSHMTNRFDAGGDLQANLTNLTANTTYWFSVVAYNADGIESLPTAALQYYATVLTPVQLGQVADGSVNVQFRGPANTACVVQYTESLNPPHWQTLGTVTAAADGSVTLNDPAAAQTSARFYRASTQ